MTESDRTRRTVGDAGRDDPSAASDATSNRGDRRDEARRGVSLRLRLTIWVVAIFAVLQWTSSGLVWLLQARAIVASVDERIDDHLVELVAQFADAPEVVDGAWLDARARAIGRESSLDGLEFTLFDPAGELVGGGSRVREVAQVGGPAGERARSTSLVAEGRERAAPYGGVVRARVVPVASDAGRWTLVGSSGDEASSRQLGVARTAILLGAVIGPAAAAIAGWFIAGLAVAPFERVRLMASRIDPESITRALPTESEGSEVDDLVRELEDARRRIEQAFAAQERFLSNVSHEIKTPISVLLVEAQTIDRDALSPPGRAFVESVEEEMAKLGRLVESFLLLTRVRDGNVAAAMRRVGVNDLVLESVDHCAAFAEQHGVRLAPELLASERDVDAAIVGVEDLLRTMLDNLVRNAVRFSPRFAVVRVGASVERFDDGGARVRLHVRDEGPGLPDELIERVFDRFAQADAEQRVGRGHGLGLAIAQGIAELHGGTISVRNLPDEGCEFTVELAIPTGDGVTPA